MQSVYGNVVSRNEPLGDYPTPQFARRSFFSLNGIWQFAIDSSDAIPFNYPYSILVPFSVETPLSGMERELKKGEVLHYRRTFTLPPDFNIGRVLLHFEAVDQVADVRLNGVRIAHHEGGYLPFTVDCLELKNGENVLEVDVHDDPDNDVYPRGKQMRKHGGLWYKPTSGIWGSVWIESVPKQVIQSVRITPNFDKKSVFLQVFFEGKPKDPLVQVSFDGKFLLAEKLDENLCAEIDLSHCFHPWSPEKPDLYNLEIFVGDDRVSSYFAMRKFSITDYRGHKVFALNNQPYFLCGVLDQGYWPESGLTPPSDEAMVGDILRMKRLGFNMLRKHIKIEPMRWYYHCDRLGMIVMQDFLNAGTKYKDFLIFTCPFIRWKFDDKKPKIHARLGRANPASREFFEKTMPEIVQRLYNVPCIGAWTLFNEGWGQFDAARLTDVLRGYDPTRPIDSTSGWFDQGVGDFNSRHIYFRAPKAKSDGKRVLSLSEFGGYVQRVEGHRSGEGKGIHYQKTKGDLTERYENDVNQTLLPMMLEEGLSVTVYTQVSDIEEEENGLLTYDRAICKVNTDRMLAANAKLRFPKND